MTTTASKGSTTRAALRAALVALGVTVLGSAALACTSAPSFDRSAAIAEVVAATEPAVTEEQAGCYVDRVATELGSSALDPGADLEDDQIRRRTVIRIDCLGAATLGGPVVAERPGVTSARDEPAGYGEDPALDALWEACTAGDGAACDRLFVEAPVGSDYEVFGATCGNRTVETSCAEVYGAPPAASEPAG